MRKKCLAVSGIMMALFMAAPITTSSALGTMTTYAAETATFSEYWFQDAQGNWNVKDGAGNVVKNAWLCDDAVTSNGKDVWYLLDSNGCMISAGLVQDQTGNFYSLETNHNGYFGMLRYKSGSYDGVNLSLESSHGGAFAAVLNQDGLNALKSKYGVTTVNIDNSNCVYTSSFGSGGSGTASTSTQQQSSGSLLEQSKRGQGQGYIDTSGLDPAKVQKHIDTYGNPNGTSEESSTTQSQQQQAPQQSTQNTQVDDDDPAELFRRISGGGSSITTDPSQIKAGDGTGLGALH